MATSFGIEDYVTQIGQGAVSERGAELLAPSEGRLLLLRNLWLREVNALAEGRELTDWKRPSGPFSPDKSCACAAQRAMYAAQRTLSKKTN